MLSVHENFLKGHYQKCLDELDIFCMPNTSENAYRMENNKLVCQTLDSASKNELISVTLESFTSLYDNYRLALKHTNRQLPIDGEVTILINIHWLALSTLDRSIKNQYVWDSLLHKVLDFCVEASSYKSMLDHHTTEFINDLLSNLLSAFESNLKHGRLMLELAICSILVITMSQNNCDEKLYDFISLVLKRKRETMAFVSIEEEPSNNPLLFKLGYFKSWQDVAEDTQCLFSWLDTLKFLKAPNGLMLKITDHNCDSRQYCQSFKNYCLAFRNYQQESYSLALGYLLNGLPMLSPVPLLYQYRCLLGQLYSVMGERYKAVESFTEAVKLIKNRPTAHYYLGREYGLMGLHENMLKSYQNLIMSYKKDQQKVWMDNPLIERILEVLNGPSICKTEAIYVLAVAYGINEMFDEASVAFEKLLNQRNLCAIVDNSDKNGISLPHIVTIYHESAAVNLLTGNLSKAEDLCRRALTIYPDRKFAETDQHHKADLHGTKDIAWIHTVLQNELQSNIEENSKTNRYYECSISFFDEDVIGLLLLADLQRIQDSDEVRITLNQALLLLSKYIARTQKDPVQSERVILVKALTAKTCLQIARMQATVKPFEDVDRMFKRALSCNNGDKDVLYHYASFLVSADKISDGEKLWNTFYEKDSIIQHEEAQSLALRYLLRTQISQRQIENLSLKFL